MTDHDDAAPPDAFDSIDVLLSKLEEVVVDLRSYVRYLREKQSP